ncbi:MAG: 30S ribosome-binding factor RbfA [Actinobacteria bacterium]|nr:30S ribosome-binding factor RbfA [Actinomycetota bacterium]
MDYPRSVRLAESLKKIISEYLHQDLKDPRIGFVTITNVEVTQDLKYATIFFSILEKKREIEKTILALENAKGHIRKKLGRELRLKFIPQLIFKIDHSLEATMRISKILNKIHQEEK